VFLLAAGAVVLNFPFVDLSQDWSARTSGQDILAGVEDHAYYFGTWGDVPILEYLQLVEGERPDVTVINLIFADATVATGLAEERVRAGYPVYSSSALLSTGSDVELREVPFCSCSRLVPISGPD